MVWGGRLGERPGQAPGLTWTARGAVHSLLAGADSATSETAL